MVPITIQDTKTNRTRLSLQSSENDRKSLDKGTYDILVDGKTVLSGFQLKAGAVYTFNVFEDTSGTFVSTVYFIVSLHWYL